MSVTSVGKVNNYLGISWIIGYAKEITEAKKETHCVRIESKGSGSFIIFSLSDSIPL